jgi:putative LysE/RhtB family amino acid efflux pump
LDISFLSGQHFIPGLLIGLAAVAPIGPVNLLVIQRSLQLGQRSALWLGLGGALGDALMAAAGVFAMETIRSFFDLHQAALRIGGGLFMILFAVLLWRQAPKLDRKPTHTGKMAGAIFFMTISNPATLLWFIAAFAMFRFSGVGAHSWSALGNGLLLVLGVFAGSMLWWLGISSLAVRLAKRFTDRHLHWLNNGCAALLLGCSAFAILTAY